MNEANCLEISEKLPEDLIVKLSRALRPVMRNSPTWARWTAQDWDGQWHWFECRPRWNKGFEIWTAAKGETLPAK